MPVRCAVQDVPPGAEEPPIQRDIASRLFPDGPGSRRVARLKLGLIVLLAVASSLITFPPDRHIGFARSGRGRYADLRAYRAEVDRMRAGEGYYEAAAAELESRGYPTGSVFNWRTPLPLWLIARLPGERSGQILLAALALAVVGLGAVVAARRAGPGAGAAAALLLTGPALLAMIDDLYLQPVMWGGVLLGLSAVAYGAGFRRLAIAVGILAPLFREFAVAWVVVCLVFAALEGRRREARLWAAGLWTFAIAIAAHAILVSLHQGPAPVRQPESWVHFEGLPFLLSTFQMNAWLLLLPEWMTGVFFVAAITGFLEWRTPAGRRMAVTLAAFTVAFLAVGLPYNQYWGLMYSALACLGAATAPRALRELWRCARGLEGAEGGVRRAA